MPPSLVNPDAARALDRLSAIAGITPSYYDLSGTQHIASAGTRSAILAAMGFDVGSDDALEHSLRAAEAQPWNALLPPVLVVRAQTGADSAAAAVPVTLATGLSGRQLRWRLALEDGSTRMGEVSLDVLEAVAHAKIEGSERRRVLLRLPPAGLGYHRLTAEAGGTIGECRLIVAPAACHRPDWYARGRRVWGVAHQLYELRRAGDLGIGDFTALGQICAEAGRLGGSYVGVNPLNALSLARPEEPSPYSPSSRVFLNPLYIDPLAEGMPPGAAAIGADAGHLIDYPAVAKRKLELLWQQFAALGRTSGAGALLDAYIRERSEPLRRYALFQALEEHFGRPSTPGFPAPGSPAAEAFAQANRDRVRFFCWLQQLAERQLASATQQLPGGLYGDLAVGVDRDGADAWIDPAAFARTVTIGAPPDPFSREGQNWNLLPFNPVHLRQSGFRPFSQLLAAAMRPCGALRLDHVMWLNRMFWIPEGGKPADGAYVGFPQDELLGVLALESHRHRCLVIGEALGTVPAGYREHLESEAVLSYRLMQFERYDTGLYKRPDTYPHSALAAPGSHDLPTTVGFWTGRDIADRAGLGLIPADERAREETARVADRRRLIDALVDQGLLAPDFALDAELSPERRAALIGAVHLFLSRSPAAVLMLNIEDLAGSPEQVNLPGPLVGYPCWQIRLDAETSEIFARPEVVANLAAIAQERSPSAYTSC